MATSSTLSAPSQTPPTTRAPLLISLASLPGGALHSTLRNITAALPGQPVLIASPDAAPADLPSVSLIEAHRLIHYDPAHHNLAAPAVGAWVLTAADFLNTFKLAQDHHAEVCLLLGPEAQSLSPEAIRALVAPIATGSADLAMPHYDFGPRDGLVTSAILYPVTRALFATRPRFPISVDLCFSLRMAERLAASAQKFTATNQNDALLWPVAEAAAASLTLTEVPAGTRTIPHPGDLDFNTLIAQILGSFFADIDARAAFWQRARTASPAPPSPPSELPDTPTPDVSSMLDAFRLAYTNLHEIWSLVLPPHSLLGLKRLSALPAESFRMPDALWTRIVYDFILAFRLRTLNRGHLLGALTPLYLAWVASHLLLTGTGELAPERHVEALATAFETDKPYLVSRWRWPDRFNP